MAAREVRLPMLFEDPNEDHSWEARARCVGHDPNIWFPSRPDVRSVASVRSR